MPVAGTCGRVSGNRGTTRPPSGRVWGLSRRLRSHPAATAGWPAADPALGAEVLCRRVWGGVGPGDRGVEGLAVWGRLRPDEWPPVCSAQHPLPPHRQCLSRGCIPPRAVRVGMPTLSAWVSWPQLISFIVSALGYGFTRRRVSPNARQGLRPQAVILPRRIDGHWTLDRRPR